MAASVASFALVVGAWAVIAESNEGRGGPDAVAVAAAEEEPLDEVIAEPVEAAPASTAATRAAKVVKAVPVGALFRSPVCPKPGKKDEVAPAEAVKAAGAEIAALGEDFPDVYSGHLGCRSAGRLIVYRVPDADFDAAARGIAAAEEVTLQLVKAPYSRQQLTDMTEWISERREKWAAAGIVIRAIANKPNGTLEVRVDPADVAKAAKKLAKHKAQVRVVPHGSSGS